MKRILLVLLLCGAAQAWAGETTKAALYVVQIAVGIEGMPLLLDNTGQVWAFSGPPSFGSDVSSPLVKLSNLDHVTQLAPYMALDNTGHVYLWHGGPPDTSVPPSPPVLYKGLDNVTWVFSGGSPMAMEAPPGREHPMYNRYIVAVGNRDIYQIGLDEDGKTLPPQRLYESTGIRAISAFSIMAKDEIVVLQTDGAVLRIDSIPKLGNSAARVSQVTRLGSYPDAIDISANMAHIAILDKSGHVTYIGACDAVRKGPGGNWVPIPGQKAMTSQVDEVTGMALHGALNDDTYPNAFIRKDGSAWIDSPQSPSSYWGKQTCAAIPQSGYGRAPQQVFHGPAPVRQLYKGGRWYYFLDAEHQVWKLEGYDRMNVWKWPKQKAAKLNLNFTPTTAGPGASEVDAIKKAALEPFGDGDADGGGMRIDVIAVKGDCAHAKAVPQGPYEGGDVYLKKENGRWVVTDYGSGAVLPPDGCSL